MKTAWWEMRTETERYTGGLRAILREAKRVALRRGKHFAQTITLSRVQSIPKPKKCKSTGCNEPDAKHGDGRCEECHKLHREDMKKDGQDAMYEENRGRTDHD